MSKKSRNELLNIIRLEYKEASPVEKRRLLDSFTHATGHNRKYATKLLNESGIRVVKRRVRRKVYDDEFLAALKQLWLASNRIAAKRFVPFIPILLDKLKKTSRLSVSAEIEEKLCRVSIATVDRILADERKQHGRSRGMTRPGRLLKNQIPIRTFSEWNDATPGFVEADLVSHCGGIATGLFLNTLTMTDIASGWTEMLPVFGKSEQEVLKAIRKGTARLPFPAKGLDTDNGCEFINYGTLGWCEKNGITFTRAREYKKNDSAHVEEKNGSIVRRLVGYDRFESPEAFAELTNLYRIARLYINYFQPSMKLILRQRDGAKIKKKFDVARTPHQRLLNSDISVDIKQKLNKEFERLDPIALLEEIEKCQTRLWSLVSTASAAKISEDSLAVVLAKAAGGGLEQAVVRVRKHVDTLKLRHRVKVIDAPQKAPGATACMRDFIAGLEPGSRFSLSELTKFGSDAVAAQLIRKLLQNQQVIKLKPGRYRKAGGKAEPEKEPEKPVVENNGKPTKDMRTWIAGLAPGTIFRPRDLYQFGGSALVAQLLRKLKQDGIVVQTVYGQYKKAEKG